MYIYVFIISAENVCSSAQSNTCNGGETSIATCSVSSGDVVCVCHNGYALNATNYCEGNYNHSIVRAFIHSFVIKSFVRHLLIRSSRTHSFVIYSFVRHLFIRSSFTHSFVHFIMFLFFQFHTSDCN